MAPLDVHSGDQINPPCHGHVPIQGSFLAAHVIHNPLDLTTTSLCARLFPSPAPPTHPSQVTMLASYLIELAQVDAGQLKYSYSLQSAAALYGALRTAGQCCSEALVACSA